MRFFEEHNGFIWEYNGIGDYFKAILARVIGSIIGFAILGLIVFLLYLYGNQ